MSLEALMDSPLGTMTIITLSLTFLSSPQPKHIPEFESAKGVEGGEGSGWEMLKGNTQVVN